MSNDTLKLSGNDVVNVYSYTLNDLYDRDKLKDIEHNLITGEEVHLRFEQKGLLRVAKNNDLEGILGLLLDSFIRYINRLVDMNASVEDKMNFRNQLENFFHVTISKYLKTNFPIMDIRFVCVDLEKPNELNFKTSYLTGHGSFVKP